MKMELEGSLPFLGELVLLLLLGGAIVYLCHRLRIAPIVGYLLAGALAGPGALGLVRDTNMVEQMAEVGVILLLFTIGLEFRLERLLRVLRLVLLGGGLQVSATILLSGLLLIALGVDPLTAVYTGMLVALSSTAVVLKVFDDQGEVEGPVGGASLAVLIFQDLTAVGMILMLPFLAGSSGDTGQLAAALVETLLIVFVVLIAARRAVPWLLNQIAHSRNQELFLLTVVTLCFGTAWVLHLAGVSLALGAFLAGLLVSESRFGLHALSQILPLRTVFSALFFLSVGMLLDPDFLLSNPLLVLGVASGVVVVKALLTGGALRLTGMPVRIAAAAGLGLAQIGEFSFVIERAGAAIGLTPAGMGSSGQQLFIAVSVLLMGVTPFLIAAGSALGIRLAEWHGGRSGPTGEENEQTRRLSSADHTVVVGYGPGGQRVCRALKSSGVSVTVIELNPMLAQLAEEDGFEVLVGDASQALIQEKAGIRQARILLIVTGDWAGAVQIVQTAHFLNSTLRIMVRTRFFGSAGRLHEAGAELVVPEELETALRLLAAVLEAYDLPQERIAGQVDALRIDDYRHLRRFLSPPEQDS